jgi:hypothetical protein
MILNLILHFFSTYLIEFMGGILILALLFRWLAFRSSKMDEIYFTAFTRELEATIDKAKGTVIEDVDSYLSGVLGQVGKKLPSRSLRFAKNENNEDKRVVNFKDYMGGRQGLILSIQAESSVFASKNTPNFPELTHRIMSQDKHWTTLLNHLPIESVSRMIDILPSLFVVFGIFGTFIGINEALPEIAKLDFNNLDASAGNLTNFVLSTTFAMKTSIAGIFFMLIMTLLNTMFPIKDKRHWIFKKVENALQMLWYHINTDNSGEREMKKVFPEILKVLQSIEQHLKSVPQDDIEKKIG